MIKTNQMQNKKIAVLLVVLISLFSLIAPLSTFAIDPTTENLQQQLNSSVLEELNQIDFSGFNDIISEFHNSKTNIFSIENIKDKVYSIISGNQAVSYNNFFASLFSNLISLILSYLPMLSVIIAIGIISNLLNGIKSKFNEKSTTNLINLVCFLSVCMLVITMVTNLSSSTGTAISGMVNQINLVFPILLTLMVGIGANASVGAFQPVVAIMSTYIADIFNYLIMPLFLVSFVFAIISNFSDNIKLDKFSTFISSLFKWGVGIVFTLFFAVFSIQGITAGSFDSVSIRTTKYTIKSYVPIMGGYLSEGMDLILASSLLIKNSVGLVGILLLITTMLNPLLQIIIFSLVLKLISAILQPLGNTKISNFLSSTSKSVNILSTSLIAIGFMYLISIGLVMTTGNVVI